MTTPAINDNINLVGRLKQTLGYPDGHTEVYEYPNGFREIVRETRPESGSSTHIGRFKKCRPWTHRYEDWVSGDVTHSYRSKSDHRSTTSYTGTLWDAQDFDVAGSPSSNLRNKSLVGALDKLKSQDFHLGNFVAEGKQAIDLVTNTSKSIAGQVKEFRRRYPKDWDLVRRWQRGGLPRHLWCKIPSKWLAIQYGWRPLLSDIQGAVEHLQRRSRFNSFPFCSVSYTATSNRNAVKDIHSATGIEARLLFKVVDRVTTFFVYGISNPTLAELSSLGLVNPAEIVWEKARYSFVVDWIVPVGKWLSALTADAGYTFITGGQSMKSEATYTTSFITNVPSSAYDEFTRIDRPSYSGRDTRFERGCYDDTPVPGLYVKNPLSFEHCANALALIAQAFR